MGNNREIYNNTISFADVSKMRDRTMKMMGRYTDDDIIEIGNTAKKLAVTEEPDYWEEVKPVKKKNVQQVKEQRAVSYSNKQALNGLYTFALVTAVLFSLVLCVRFLQTQTAITEKNNRISQLKKEISVMTSQNDSMDYSINSYIDVQNIYKVATEELGMVVASEEQVKLYKSSELEYMKQLSDIPD